MTRGVERELDPFSLWAKSRRDSPGVFHALPYHLIDVGAAGAVLLRRLPSRAKEQFLSGFGEDGEMHCAFLAAAHDVGKANKYFQKKCPDQARRLAERGLDLGHIDEPVRHGQATGAFLRQWLIDRWGWSGFEALSAARAVGGHHGSFFRDFKRASLGLDEDLWWEAGVRTLDQLAIVFGVGPIGCPQPMNPFLGWLAGFVSVADWLGSHDRMTVWKSDDGDLSAYLSDALGRAEELLDELKWFCPEASSPLSLAELLPEGVLANGLQVAADEISGDFSLAVIEAPTGEGKTEAAFAMAEPGRSRSGGLFFALPTMATANGMHGRVKSYLRRATGLSDVDARLLHSQAWLHRDRVESSGNPGYEGEEQAACAQDWFAGSKRGLLAPYGVGTIDQALIAALRAKHGFVRLFALSGKVIVVDEVHAYDVYMGNILGVLLGWLRALGCQVVMLSATLPRGRRHAILRSWGVKGDLPHGQYPCITWVASDGSARSRSFEVQSRKPLALRLMAVDEVPAWQQGAEEVLALVRRHGGLGALVLNTVRDAQNAYDWLVRRGLDGIALDLFHARFTAKDRARIEGHVLENYGKAAVRNGPRILIATQVVEQSLDLDFDHMVTSLAPIDLLIQRAGRLHRHRRDHVGRLNEGNAADERPLPELIVLAPPLVEGYAPKVDDFVYSHDVLFRTLALLRDGYTLNEPSDVSTAIEAVYSEDGRSAIVAEWEHRLSELEAKAAGIQARHDHAARCASIEPVDDPDNLIVEAFLDLDENDERQGSRLSARTRLEDRPSVTLALLWDRETTVHGESVRDLRAGLFACLSASPPFPLWEALIQIEPLEAWRRKGALAYARPLRLAEGHCTVGEYTLSYCEKRGLDWRKTNA